MQLYSEELYGPVNTVKGMSNRSVSLLTFFPGNTLVSKRLAITCVHAFASNWQLYFLYQRKGETDRRNDCIIRHHESYVAELGFLYLQSDALPILLWSLAPNIRV